MKRAVIYCRVSTKEQAETLSLGTQQEACVDYCRRHGIDIEEVFVEKGESAKTADRPAFREMISYCDRHRGRVDYVVVYSLTRFSRNVTDHHAVRAVLAKSGIELRSVTEPIDDTATGRFTENMLAAVAQLDNDVRADRTIAGMQSAMRRGRWTHRAPLGYLNGNTRTGEPSLVSDPERAPLVVEAFKAFGSGALGKAEVLRLVTSSGLTTRRGNPIGPQQFDRMFRNAIYVGRVVAPAWGIDVKGDFEPLIEPELFARVQALLRGRSPASVKHVLDNPEFPLRRFIRCAECGSPLTGSWSTGRRGRRYAYYRCRNPKCRTVNAPSAEIESAFESELASLSVQPPIFRLFREAVLEAHEQRKSSQSERTEKLDGELVDVKKRKRRLVEAFVYEKAIDRRTYQDELDRLNSRIAQVEFDLDQPDGSEVPDLDHALTVAEELLNDPAGTWRDFPPKARLRFQRLVFPEGLTFDGEAFGTAATAPVFGLLEAAAAGKECLASPSGRYSNSACTS